MLVLTRAEVKAAVTMHEAIEACARGLAAYSSKKAEVPIRTPIEAPKGVSLFMPGMLPGERALGIKIVSVFGDNPSRGLPTVTALMVLNDIETGEPVVAMEAGYLTALRTGAASGVATEYLAREDSRSVLVIGAGVQARTQLEAVLAVRRLEEALIYDVNPHAATTFAAEATNRFGIAARAVSDANAHVPHSDMIIAATTSKEPVFDGRLVKPGTHINGIGSYTPAMREIDEHLVKRADRFVCDSAEGAWKEAGDLLTPLSMGIIDRDRIDCEVGDMVLGCAPGRLSSIEITVYKGVGLAALDLVTARLIYDRAVQREIGTKIDLYGVIGQQNSPNTQHIL